MLLGDWSADDSNILHSLFSSVTPVKLLRTNGNITLQEYRKFQEIGISNKTHITKTTAVTGVVIFVSFTEILTSVWNVMKNSIWWNHETQFLIVNRNPERNFEIAKAFLNTLWHFRLLFAVYLSRN